VSIGDKVRATRKAAGISQEEVARRAGVSLNVINRLERGVILDPHYSTLRGIASALGVSVEDLVREPALAGKAEAPKAGPATPEAYFRVPYGPGGRAKAREEAVRFIEEAADRGELRPNDVVVRFTGEAVELHHISDAEKHPVYGPWVTFSRRFSDRWRRKIAEGAFDRGSYQEFIDVIEDLTPVLVRLGLREREEQGPDYEFTYGPTIDWAVSRIHDLFNPMILAATEKLEEDELARLRRERDELESGLLRAANG
jgi:transcriptional regulator with XRE-family HTH domain